MVLKFLSTGALPCEKKEAARLLHHAKQFIIQDGVLWKWNGDKPLLQVVLSPEIRHQIVGDAHDGSGHQGCDPMYFKLKDSYWFLNMYRFVADYCRTCHECQLRSMNKNTILIQPQYVWTLL